MVNIAIMEELVREKQRALLVFPSKEKQSALAKQRREEELVSLVSTMGLEALSSLFFTLRTISASTLLGKGQIEEIRSNVTYYEADLVIFDTSLSPTVLRNLEKSLDICCIDREEVILQIFADRAATREAVLQVSLARAIYSLPRLSRRYTALSQQRGGVRGSKGEGEKQLELDRRRLEERIVRLKKELEKVKSTRKTQRKSRTLFSFAITGYTNAGKSSLINALCNADALVEDKLFATLDTTTRRIELKDGAMALVSDTVGFVSRLPHELIEAFSSTLEEAVLSDCVIIVIDSSSPAAEAELATTEEVLDSLGCKKEGRIYVLSKIDKEAEDELARARLEALLPDAVHLSTVTGEGLEELRERMQAELEGEYATKRCILKACDSEAISGIYRKYRVLSAEWNDEEVTLVYRSRRG